MDMEKDVVCRLCLRVPHKGFVLIDETVRQMFTVLLVEMNLDVSNQPLICEDCVVIAKKSLFFVLVCLNSERTMLTFGIEDKTNVGLRDVYGNNSQVFNRNGDMCCFCVQKVEERCFVQLDVLLEESTYSDMLKEFMFQLDMNIIKNPLICFHCQDYMENHFKFLQNCHDTEKRINTYQQNKGIRRDEKVVLGNVLETFFKYTKEEKSDTENVKLEAVPLDMNNQSLQIKTEELGIKDEVTSSEVTKAVHRSGICTCEVKTEMSPRSNSVSKVAKCNLSLLTRKDFSQIQMYHCDSCGYQTKHKSNFKNHLLTHKDVSEVQMYQCDSCEYQTKYKGGLNKHLLTHKNFSEVQLYHCDSCEFRTKFKCSLKKHLLTHKDISEVQVYQCDSCEYQTKYKGTLKEHLSTHKDFAEVQMYQCDSCDYQTKQKWNLKQHTLIHRDSAEVQMYQCDSCEFQTKHKRVLERHFLTHKDISEVQAYQCNICEFHTKYKGGLNKHLLTHKNLSEVQLYHCDSCKFRTKFKGSLKRHLLAHKDFSKVEAWYNKYKI